jgi:hypothetical protein
VAIRTQQAKVFEPIVLVVSVDVVESKLFELGSKYVVVAAIWGDAEFG